MHVCIQKCPLKSTSSCNSFPVSREQLASWPISSVSVSRQSHGYSLRWVIKSPVSARLDLFSTRDAAFRGLPEIAVYRVDAEGRLRRLGLLVPVYPEGFVMRQDDGKTLHSEGLPWWLYDMRPQGYLGRAYAARYGAALQLPERLVDWTDTHALRALLAHGGDSGSEICFGRYCPGPLPCSA